MGGSADRSPMRASSSEHLPLTSTTVLGQDANSSRSGYIPVPIGRVPLEALRNIAIHLRTNVSCNDDAFTLFCGPSIEFTEKHRARLSSAGVSFIYIPIAQHAQFRKQTEDALLKVANDPTIAASVRSEIIYQTSVQLANELLSEPDLASVSARLEQVSRSVTNLVLNDENAFAHLF